MVTGRNQQHFTKNICRKIKITNNMKKGRENDNAIQHSDNNEKMNLRSIVDSRYVAAAAAADAAADLNNRIHATPRPHNALRNLFIYTP